MRRRRRSAVLLALAVLAALSGCGRQRSAPPRGRRTVVVTYTILASVVGDLVGDAFDVKALIPNGLDPHEWEPSAKDMGTLFKAALIVENGLGLEAGMEKALGAARKSGVHIFTAADHVRVKTAGKGGEAVPKDPHLWTDPLAMKAVIEALAAAVREEFQVDLSARARDLGGRLDGLDAEIRSMLAAIPPENRRMVTGHESMGYYAERYGVQLVGAIVPGLTPQAEVSAADMSGLKKLIAANRVKAVFVEQGTPPAAAEALSRDAGVRAVALNTHGLPEDGSYFSYLRDLTKRIVGGME